MRPASNRRATNKQESLEAGFSALASKTFEGIRIADMAAGSQIPSEVAATVEQLLAMNDQQLLAEVIAAPQKMMDVGTACVSVQKWHEAMAAAHGALLSRIGCCVAKNLKRLEAA